MRILTKNLLIPTGARVAIAVLALSVVTSHSAAAQSKNTQEIGAVQSLTMGDVISSVIKNNDRAAASRYMETAARRRVGPAGAWDDPMLMVGVTNLPTSGSFSDDMMTMKMVGVSQTIPYAGQKGLARAAARSEADAALEMTRGVEVDLVTAAKLAYLEFYFRRRILEDLKSQRSLLEDIVGSVEGKLRTSQANQEDLSAAQADLWRLDASILSAEQELDAAQFDLNALMGNAPDFVLRPPAEPQSSPLPATVEPWERAAGTNYPPLRRLANVAEGFARSSGAAARMRWPMLTLSANYGFREDGPMGPRDDMVAFVATMSLPVFAGRKQGDMALSMQAMQQSSDAEARQLWRDVRGKLWTLHARARRLEQSVTLYRERIIPAADDAFRSAFAGYSANRTSFVTLLTYAVAIYRDRVTADLIALDLAQTRSESERYTADPKNWAMSIPNR